MIETDAVLLSHELFLLEKRGFWLKKDDADASAWMLDDGVIMHFDEFPIGRKFKSPKK